MNKVADGCSLARAGCGELKGAVHDLNIKSEAVDNLGRDTIELVYGGKAASALLSPLSRWMGSVAAKLGFKAVASAEEKAAAALMKVCSCCFVAGTPVWTANGMVPIEQIKVGTLVRSRDEISGDIALKPVTNLIYSPGREIFALVLVDQAGKPSRLEVSDNHPFHVRGAGWVDSAKLTRGMRVNTLNGQFATVANLQSVGRTADTFNLTIADYHTFFAGSVGAWVHNTCPCAAAAKELGPTVGELRAAGLKDAHHPIQDAAVRDLKGYNTNAAPGVVLEGPSNLSGTAHNLATAVQRQAGGGTYAAERRIGYKALRRGGLSESEARSTIERADSYFESIGVTPDTITRIPGNRR